MRMKRKGNFSQKVNKKVPSKGLVAPFRKTKGLQTVPVNQKHFPRSATKCSGDEMSAFPGCSMNQIRLAIKRHLKRQQIHVKLIC